VVLNLKIVLIPMDAFNTQCNFASDRSTHWNFDKFLQSGIVFMYSSFIGLRLIVMHSSVFFLKLKY